MSEGPVRELTYEERATWGTCPVCSAPHGEFCNSNVGFSLGRNVNGEIPPNGVHLGRLQNAPLKAQLVGVR